MATKPRPYLIIYALLLLLLSACTKEERHADTLSDNSEEMMVSPDISNQNVKAFAEDTLGHVWMATFRGVDKYDGHEYQQYFCTDDSVGLTDNNVNTLFRDSHGRLWAGTVNGPCFYTDQDRFQRAEIPTQNRNCIQFAETGDGRVLLYNISEILEYDEQSNRFEVKRRGMLVDRTFHGRIHTASDGRLWVGTPSCLRRYDGERLTVKQRWDVFMPLSFAADRQGTVWTTTSSVWLYAFSDGKSEPERLQLYPETFLFTPCITRLDNGQLLIAAFNQKPLLVDPQTRQSSKLPIEDADWEKCIRRSVFIPVATRLDTKGNVWFGTNTNGVLVYSLQTHRLTPVGGLSCNDITAIEEDEDGNLWLSTMDGLNCYDPRTHKATAFYKDQGIGGNQFTDRSSCRLPDGTLVFGGTHGLTIFNPNNRDTQRNAPLVLEYLKIHNEVEHPGSGAIETNLSACKEIRLSHSQNSFSITYASLDYNDQQRTHYYYMLDGLDNDWHDSGQGIPEDQLEAVFRRYYQVDNQTRGTINWGTGIGLYYARRLATLHHGYIKAANRHEGTGAVFSILLPISTATYTEEERAAQLLRDGRYNVSEVANLTGFSTQSHFATLFKKQFGMTPTEYMA